ncbi:hypothetical protein Hanom_Chr12g01122971 [Helianthus anomalus]
MSTGDDIITVEEAGSGLPSLKWDQCLLEQGQTAADAPPDYITLFADFFSGGNFRLPAIHFLGNILQYYGFHVSQMSPISMVRVRHFEFVCWSQGDEPTVDRFRIFYHL